MSDRSPRGRGWRRRVLLVICQVAVVLVLAEIAVRVAATRHRGLRMVLNASSDVARFDDASTLPELMDRTVLGFSPGTVQYGFVLNSRSFRTREYEPVPAPDRFRVVALGDSFTFASGGLPHGDHWTTLTEWRLRRTVDARAEVLSLGVPDTGPAFQLRLWQLEGTLLAPDAVVLAFFVGNDFVDHRPGLQGFAGRDEGLVGRLASASALVRVGRNLIRIELASPKDGRRRPHIRGGSLDPGQSIRWYAASFDPDRPTFTREHFLAIESQRMALCLKSETDAFNEAAEAVIPVVLQLAEEVEAAGARFVVMVIPDQYQVDSRLLNDILGETGNRRDDYDLERPQRELVGALNAAGVETLDLLPTFRRAARHGKELYRPRDTHWNRRGNLMAARPLADLLARGGGSIEPELFSDGLESGGVNRWSSTGG